MASEVATTISWRMLTGNRFRRDLLPEMFTEDGCVKQQSIRRIGDVSKSVFDVMYDADYAFEYLERKICRVLAPMGRERVHRIIDKAWDLYERQNSVNQPKSL
jgi:hypothetical protein